MHIKKIITSTAAAAALGLAGISAQAYTIDLNSQIAGAQQSLNLAAGTYSISVVSGTFSGWTYQFNNPAVREAFWVSQDGGATAASIDVPNAPSNTFTSYASSADALTAFSTASALVVYAGTTDRTVVGTYANHQFTLATPTTLTFGIPDNKFDDNTGGVSLSIVADPVPEPETLALMLAGLAAIGFAVRRRKTA